MQINYQKLINKWSVLLLSLLLYIISLTQTGFILIKQYDKGIAEHVAGDPAKGFFILEAGWLDIIVLDFSWCANIFYLFALLYFLADYRKWALRHSVAATFIGCLSFFSPAVYSLQIGFYLWMSSFLVLFLYLNYYRPKYENNTVDMDSEPDTLPKDDSQQP